MCVSESTLLQVHDFTYFELTSDEEQDPAVSVRLTLYVRLAVSPVA